MYKEANISDCGKHRYRLYRSWRDMEKDEERVLVFVMLNPSTADASVDDPTIRKCITIAKNFGFNSIEVINLYAYRSTDPCALLRMGLMDAIGEHNQQYAEKTIARAHAIVVAWGKQGGQGTHQMQRLLKGKGVLSLAVNKDGSPKHPLYCRNDSELTDWKFSRNIDM